MHAPDCRDDAQAMKKMHARTLPDLVRKAEALGVEPVGARG
ncbi:hypothetical protein [Burkholderia ubonensis]|nr:hypothetical protein [Burkholderia ubonensis]